MDKVFVSPPRDRGFGSNTDHNHDSSYEVSTGWLHEADSRVLLKLNNL